MARQEVEYSTLGKYKVMGVLGRGSMGVVYRAFDPEIGRTVAIKTLRKIEFEKFGGVEGALERFRNEARSAGNLRHPNIITIFEVARDGDVPFIVMDCVEGQSLDTIINRLHRVPPAQTMGYLIQVAAALDYAHSRGVIHRDIKPSNIMVDSAGTVFVLDFGVASITKSYAEWDPPVDTPIVGTPGYMSPEQILNQKLDGRTDVFSLGVVAYELLSGSRPFHGDSFGALLHSVVHGDPTPLTTAAPDLPLALEAEFERALARDPEDRFKNATDMVMALSKSLGILQPGFISLSGHLKAPPKEEEPPPPPKRKHGAASGQWKASSINPVARPKPKKPQTPGEVFNSADAPSLLREEPQPTGLDPMKIAIALCLMGFGIAAVWVAGSTYLLTDQPPAEVQAMGGKKPSVDPVPSAAPLINPPVETAPADASLFTFNDRQLIGLIRNRDTEEAQLVNALKEAHRRRIPDLVDASVVPLEHDSYVVRLETLKILADMGDRRIVPKVLLLLDDYDPLVRAQAARALGNLGDRSAVSYLYARLAKEESSEVQRALRKAIETISGLPVKDSAAK